ncbi:hypothetical protein A6D98_19675 [Aliivibrio fischeri]|uniref:hypothetical protein n=1 Tax=Aliivibrio fischeri TaxID=668 RepID=UPI00080EBFD9|nr:hypothetical protein [Aliivibrio fischeri]OCH57231.1 hypothetical protein A6D98_19675 [Aliivibrio fischeri]
MKEIITDFVKGSSTEKLAIVSNFSTILGVSVATFVAGPFLSKFADMEFIVSDFIIAILFYFICFWMAADFVYSIIVSIGKDVKEKKTTNAIGNILLMLFLSWLAIVIFPYAKYYSGNIFNNSYLLPPSAQKSIVDITDFQNIEKDNLLTLKGEVQFKQGINGTDYELVLYSKSQSGFYRIKELSNNDNSFKLSASGKFTIPYNIGVNNVVDPILVVYRNSDWSVFSDGFPQGMSQLPSFETDKVQAFIYIPKT